MIDRSKKGEEIYIQSMEKSVGDKTKIFPYVRPGVIVDIGAGAGPLDELLLREFPGSKIVAVDLSDEMIKVLNNRFKNKKNIEIVKSSAQDFKYSEKVNTFIFVSTMHEVFSFSDYSHEEVLKTLKNCFKQLAPHGRLIIRDGIQPEDKTLYLKPKNEWSYERFFKFVKEFHVRPLIHSVGTFHNDTFVQHKAGNYQEFDENEFLIEMHSQDLSELLSKYHYDETNWPIELTEQFGIWTLREYQHILIELGFSIVHAETYVLQYLLDTHYYKDFDVYERREGRLIKAEYPPSTMILVAEK